MELVLVLVLVSARVSMLVYIGIRIDTGMNIDFLSIGTVIIIDIKRLQSIWSPHNGLSDLAQPFQNGSLWEIHCLLTWDRSGTVKWREQSKV